MSIETLPPLARPIYARLVSAAVDALEDGESVTTAQWLAMRATALGEAMASFRLPALPRPPQPTAAAIVTMIEAHLASRWVAIGGKKIPYDAPGTSLLERAWKWMLAQDREMMASIYPPQPTSTKAEP